MKRKIVLMVLSSAMILAMLLSPMHNAKATLSPNCNKTWLGDYRYVSDPYWPTATSAFLEGSTATLLVEVNNPSSTSNLNVSDVSVFMDWATANASSAECSQTSPYVLPPQTSHWFTLDVAVPLVATIPKLNLVAHRYRIYVNTVNATTGPKDVTDFANEKFTGFYIHSTTQKEATRLWNEVVAFDDWVSWPWGSIEARNTWNDALVEKGMGEVEVKNANFAGAVTHFQNALDMMDDALAFERDYDFEDRDYTRNQTRMEDELNNLEREAFIAETNSTAQAILMQANATEMMAEAELSQAQALATQALGWIVFGFGFLVIGIAACIWAYRRPIRTS